MEDVILIADHSLAFTRKCVCPQSFIRMFDDSPDAMVLTLSDGMSTEYVTAHSFHTEDEFTLYLPPELARRFDDDVTARAADGIPVIERLAVRANENDFATKEMFEVVIPRDYQVLCKGDTLYTNGCYYEVVDLVPDDTVRTLNSDPVIDIVKPPTPERESYASWLSRANKDPSMWRHPRLQFVV